MITIKIPSIKEAPKVYKYLSIAFLNFLAVVALNSCDTNNKIIKVLAVLNFVCIGLNFTSSIIHYYIWLEKNK